MEEKDINQVEEPVTKRPLIIRILAILGALALPALAYFLFRYGYLWII